MSSQRNTSSTLHNANISSDSLPAWYFFSHTTLLMPQLIMSIAQVRQGVMRQYSVLFLRDIPNLLLDKWRFVRRGQYGGNGRLQFRLRGLVVSFDVPHFIAMWHADRGTYITTY
jgi:hypothetical protein